MPVNIEEPEEIGSFSYPVAVRKVGPDGRSVRIEADPAELQVVAARLNIPSVDRLIAELELISKDRRTVDVSGRIEATVHQSCVVTLKPVEERIQDTFFVRMVPDGLAEWQDLNDPVNVLDDDVPDVYHGGVIRLGDLVAEHLALALNPYPRADGAEFESDVEQDSGQDESPFAALQALKKQV